MERRGFIVLIGLLVILFVTGISTGLLQTDSTHLSASQERLLEWINNLVPKKALVWDDLSGANPSTCLADSEQKLAIATASSCEINIVPSQAPRVLRLFLRQGTLAQIKLIQPVNRDGDRLTMSKDLAFNQQLELDIYRQQSAQDRIALTIQCGSLGEDCQLELH